MHDPFIQASSRYDRFVPSRCQVSGRRDDETLSGNEAYPARRQGGTIRTVDVRDEKGCWPSWPSIDRTLGRWMMVFSFSLHSSSILIPVVVNRRTPSPVPPPAVGIPTLVDPLPPLQWTLTDPVRGRERGIRTPSSGPLSWTPLLSSVLATTPWQHGCLVH